MLLAFLDTPQRHDQLTVFPVVASEEPDISLVSAADAVRTGVLTFREKRQGSTSVLIAENCSCKPVLILDGEKLFGGRRYRLRTPSILLGPDSETEIPFWGVEHERGARTKQEGDLPGWLNAFPVLNRQVGILAFLGRRFLGLDALGSPRFYAPFHCRLLTEHLMGAFGARRNAGRGSPTHDSEVCALAGALESAERIPSNTPGRGRYRVLKGPVRGGELSHEGRLVHLSVFPAGVGALG